MTDALASGVVVAPAGYGKTHRLIALLAAPARHLVLTHTNVAVSNIRRRSPRASARVETIDSLARRLATAFPIASCVPEDSLDWQAIRAGAVDVLNRPAIRRALAASYDQLLVDEYQDCSADQVLLIRRLAEAIPTIAFGDPLQSIFDPLSKDEGALTWEDKVAGWPVLESLQIPWRWSTDAEHGDWVVAARHAIEQGQPVAIGGSTVNRYHVTDTNGAYLSRLIGRHHGSWAIIVGNSKRAALLGDIAKRHRWNAMEVAELTYPGELREFSSEWDSGSPVRAVLQLAKSCMTNCGKVTSFTTCLKNSELGVVNRAKSPLATQANEVHQGGSPTAALSLLGLLERHPDTAIYRPDLLDRAKRALRIAEDATIEDMESAVDAVQAGLRAGAIRQPKGPLVGSVLRLKGLEFDHVAIVEPNAIGTREELYVAVSRARRSCSVVTTPLDDPLRWFSDLS